MMFVNNDRGRSRRLHTHFSARLLKTGRIEAYRANATRFMGENTAWRENSHACVHAAECERWPPQQHVLRVYGYDVDA